MKDINKLEERVKFKIAISKIDDEENDITMNKKKIIMNKKIGMVACACLILTTGVVFAKDISNYFKNLFNNSTKAIDVAVENGYVQQENMDYTYSNDIGIKIDNLVLDELHLNISFNFEIKKENIKSIRLDNFIITNDNGEIVFSSEFKSAETPEELPLYNSLTWSNEPIKLTDTTFTDSILLGLREHEDFKELYFDVKSLQITYMDDTRETIDGNWNFNVTITDEMRENTTVIYSMIENNEYIESCTAKMDNTGTIIELISKEKIPNITYEKDGVFLLELIYLSVNDRIYETREIDFNEERMTIRFENLGNFIENSDTLELHLEFFNTTITLVKKTN